MKPKTQIMIIHGGDTFKTKKDYLKFLKTRKISIKRKIKWRDEYLRKKLKNFEIICPRMPLQDNANYKDWKIQFERHFPYLKNNIILIGSSLGGTFLAKYLSENKFPKKILSTYLVAPPYDGMANGFKFKSDLRLLEKNTKHLYLMFSKEDNIVPVSHADKFRKKLKGAKIIIYKGKNGHFVVPKFPEIVKLIKKDKKSIK